VTDYLLDTNALSYLADIGSPYNAPVTTRLEATPADARVSISILTHYEVAFAAGLVPAFANMQTLIESEFEVLPLPAAGAEHFVRLKGSLATRRGVSPKNLARHNTDLMIAATALALDFTLVSTTPSSTISRL
jgi:predicted nucleic acid-binding protein